MKKHFLLLFLIISNVTILYAQSSLRIDASCVESKNLESKFIIKISSDKLELSEDAIQDNLGGYVDIAEDRYYLKTSDTIYRLSGVVEHNFEDKINKFTGFITKKELYNLKDSNNLKFIQKINLIENNQQWKPKEKTTTHILNVYIDKSLFEKEYQKCEEKMIQSTQNSYLPAFLLIFIVLLIIYFKRKKR